MLCGFKLWICLSELKALYEKVDEGWGLWSNEEEFEGIN